MELQVITQQGSSSQSLKVSDEIFARDYHEPLVHQVVTAYQAGGRAGTKAQKNRSDVSGGGIKPWRQKGTGRARVGSNRSPLWRHGGVTFAARPRDFEQKINKKTYRVALRSILSELVRQQRLVVVNTLTLEAPKTKMLIEQLKKLDCQSVLILLEERQGNVELAARNIPNVLVETAKQVGPVDLIAFPKVLATEAAVKQLQERLA